MKQRLCAVLRLSIVCILTCALFFACNSPTYDEDAAFLQPIYETNNYAVSVMTVYGDEEYYAISYMIFDGTKYYENSFGEELYREYAEDGVYEYTKSDDVWQRSKSDFGFDNTVFAYTTIANLFNIEYYEYNRSEKYYDLRTEYYKTVDLETATNCIMTFVEGAVLVEYTDALSDAEGDTSLVIIRISNINNCTVTFPTEFEVV